MDNLTHSFAGWAIGQAGLKTKTRKGLAALILGANMPDIDVFFGWVSWAPLSTHRGVTHSFLGGVVLMPPVLALLLWLLDKWQTGRGTTFKSGLDMHFGWLVILAYIGTITHPLLDLQTSYAVQLFTPFDTRWYHEESLFIIDLWLWIGMGYALWLSRKYARSGGNWRKPARIALAASSAYIGMNTLLTMSARAALLSSPAMPRPDVIFTNIPPLKFWQRRLVYRQERQIASADWSPFAGLTNISAAVPDNMRDPFAQKAMRATPRVIDFMRWSAMTTARVKHQKCLVEVTFNDARYSAPLADNGFSTRKVTLKKTDPGCNHAKYQRDISQ
jgi:inner membrane protein